MNEFLLLFRGGEDMSALRESPEAYQKQLTKWKSWMESLGKQGKFIGGQPLAGGGTVIKGKRKVVTDGPFVEGKEIVGGYILIKAKDMQDAVTASRDCPIFDADGIVEAREVRQLQA